MHSLIMKFIKEEDGATMVEYAIMVALIAVVAIAAVVLIGTETNEAFTTIGETMEENKPAG